jgi:hypothetical protein
MGHKAFFRGTGRAIKEGKEDAAMTRIAKLSTVLLTFFLLISLGLLGSTALADRYVTVYNDGRHGHGHHYYQGHGHGHRHRGCEERVVVNHYAPRPYYVAPSPPVYYAPAPSSGVHISGGIFFNDWLR